MSSKLAKKSIPVESGAGREFILRSEQKVNHFDKYVWYWLFVPFRQDAIITSIADSERPNFSICDRTQDISLAEVTDGGSEVGLVLLEGEVNVWMATGFGEF